METVMIAVNGTLMRGLALNTNMTEAGATFVRKDCTNACYRLWSIDEQYPGMQKVAVGGQSIELEIWQLTASELITLLEKEPPGLCLGRVELMDGTTVPGILAEAYLCEGMEEITVYGGWRAYIEARPDQGDCLRE